LYGVTVPDFVRTPDDANGSNNEFKQFCIPEQAADIVCAIFARRETLSRGRFYWRINDWRSEASASLFTRFDFAKCPRSKHHSHFLIQFVSMERSRAEWIRNVADLETSKA